MSVEIPLTGGVNLLDDPRRIRDDEVAWAKNLVPIKPGVLSSRPALQFIPGRNGSAVGASVPFTAIAGLPFPVSGFAATQQPTSPGTNLLVSSSGGDTLAQATIASCTNPWMFSFGSVLYVLPGPNSTSVSASAAKSSYVTVDQYAGPVYSDPTVSAGNGARITKVNFAGANQDVYPKVGAAYRQRVAWANFGGAYSRYVVLSDNYKPNTVGDNVLAANGRAFELAGGAPGDEIIALHEVMLTAIGSPAQSALLVLMRYGAYLITGQLNQSDGSGTNDMVVNKVSFEAGCISPWSVATSPYGTFWVGPDDVWFFSYGQVPTRIGTKIRPAIQGTPVGAWNNVRAVYFDGFLRVQLAGDGQSPDQNTAFTDEWWLDLRHGPPQDFQQAQWWGPQQLWSGAANDTAPSLAVPFWFLDKRAGGASQLLGITPIWGAVPNFLGLVSLSSQSSRDDLSNPDPTTGIDANVWRRGGTEILVDLRCKEYDEGAPAYQKLFQSLFLALWINLPTRLLVDILSGDGAPLTTCTRDVSYSASDFVLGASQLGGGPGTTTGRGVRQIQSVGVYSDPTVRVIGNTMQPRVYTQTGVLIVAGVNDTIVFAAWPSGSSGPTPRQYIVTLPAGLYADFGAIATALDAAPVTSSGGPVGTFGSFNIGLNRDDGGLFGAVGAWYLLQDATGGNAFIINMMPNSVRVTNAFASNQQLQACRTLLALMGFGVAGLGSTETDLVGVYDGGSDSTIIHAPNATYPLVASAIEISGAQLQTELIRRTP